MVTDLFSGCGGLAYGFHKLGWKLTSYEMWHAACEVHRKNFPDSTVICRQLTISSEITRCQVLIGGPPCQPFSVVGNQRGQYDERDMVPIFIKCIEVHKPLIALMENVENLAGKKHIDYLSVVIDDIKALGYVVDWRIVNCVNYGIAQNRKRIVIVAHRGGFEFPTHMATGNTVADVLPSESFDAASANLHPELILTKNMDEYIAKYEAKSKCVTPRDLHADRPARTLTCRNLCGATSDMIRIRLSDGCRRQLTVEEAAMIQTFPQNYFQGASRAEAMKMIGNSVPPALSIVLAAQVLHYVNGLTNAVPTKLLSHEMFPSIINKRKKSEPSSKNKATKSDDL